VTLTLILTAAAVLGFAWAMWVQVRWMKEDAATFRRKRKRAAFALAVLLLTIGLVQALATGTLRPRLFVPEEDGAWGMVSIDGMPVRNGAWTINVTDGKIKGGRDDCNYWSFEEEGDAAGERMIHTTLVACEEEDPMRKAYWTLANAPETGIELRSGGWLRIAAQGHQAMLRRCEWVDEPLPPGSTGPKVCVTQ
jgi:hypothetical protein